MSRLAILACAMISIIGVAFAVNPDEVLKDPALEARAREIGRELRCVTCQSQSIEDSDAPLAKDLRILVRERLVAGDTNEQIVGYVSARYGDYVRLKPRFGVATLLLWLTPLLTLGVGGLFAAFYFRRTRELEDTTTDSDADAVFEIDMDEI